jgi:hypothetical protein
MYGTRSEPVIWFSHIVCPAAYLAPMAHTMLEKLSEEVRECLRHAEESAAQAKIEPHPAIQRDFIDMELRWLKLARSYQFLNHLRTFSAEHDKQTGELSVRLEQLRGQFASRANGHRR